jgi:hypothetical protein
LTLTVVSPTTLTINDVPAPTSVTTPAGTNFSVGITDGPANAGDWIAIFPAGAQYDWQYIDRKYLDGQKSLPETGQANAIVDFLAPTGPGEYEVRFYAANEYPAIQTSTLIVSPTPATLRVNGSSGPVTVAAGAALSVSVADGPSNPRDSVRLFTSSAI